MDGASCAILLLPLEVTRMGHDPLRPTPLSLPGILLSLVSKDLLDKEIGEGDNKRDMN